MKPKPKSVLPPKEIPCTCNVGTSLTYLCPLIPDVLQMGICQVHVKFALKKSNSAPPKSFAAPVEEPLKRKASVKKKSEGSKSAKIEKKESPEKVKPGVVNTLPPVEKEEFTIKIINFVAIKVAIEEPGPARRRSVKKRRESEGGSKEKVPGLMEKPPLPSISPPPLPRDPSPPSPTPPPPKSPTPLRDPTPPPPREPTPPPPPKSPTPPPVKVSNPTPPRKPSPPPSPAYQRKFFPNPVASEPYKPKIRDIPTVKTTRRRKVEEYVEEAAPLRRREVSMEVKPVKFSGVAENCIKKALFLGDQYVGEGKPKVGEQEVVDKRRASKQESRRSSQQESSRRSSQQGSRRVSYYESGTETETGRSRSNSKTPLRDGAGQESRPKKKKTKASTKIIDILTAKKMKDELSAGETTENGRSTPKQTRRKLSEYVSEKLRMDNNRSSKSRSNTPGSPQRSKRIVQMRTS